MQSDSPQSGVFITLAGIAISGVVDAIDGNFDLLRVGIRGVVMFMMLALFLLVRSR
jgi:hypothetical protein